MENLLSKMNFFGCSSIKGGCFLVATLFLFSGQVWASASPKTKGNDYSSYMLQLVNEDRERHGSPILEENPKLDYLAQVYANYLLQSGFFGHVDPFGRSPQDRAALYGIQVGISENLAWAASNYEVPPLLIQKAENSMMQEPSNQLNHRYNILNPNSRFVGIGVAKAGDKILIVQEFSQEQP